MALDFPIDQPIPSFKTIIQEIQQTTGSPDPYTLIIHLDVNKTIIAVDKAENRSLDDTLNILLAERYKYCWRDDILEPISYYDYVCDYLIPGNRHDGQLKWERRSITKNFVNFLQETDHPLKQEVCTKFYAAKEKLQDHYVFPSFFRLVRKLREDEIDFHIILRSFGKDMLDVVKVIENALPEEKFTHIGYFKEGALHLGDSTIEKAQEIYSRFKSNNYQHMAIQDDWKEWNDHHERLEYGKKFPVDVNDPYALSVFIDDNIVTNPNSVTNIVSPINAEDGSTLSMEMLFEEKILHSTDTFAAILDETYFIKVLEDTLKTRKKSQLTIVNK